MNELILSFFYLGGATYAYYQINQDEVDSEQEIPDDDSEEEYTEG